MDSYNSYEIAKRTNDYDIRTINMTIVMLFLVGNNMLYYLILYYF